MKQWLVEVDETQLEQNIYIVEAENEKAARFMMLQGYGEGILELRETYVDSSEITQVRCIKPYEDPILKKK